MNKASVKPVIDLNHNPVVGGVTRIGCKTYIAAARKKAKLKKAYPESDYIVGRDGTGYFIMRTR